MADIEKAKILKTDKQIYEDALKLFEEKKHLEAIELLNKITQVNAKWNDLAQKKTDEKIKAEEELAKNKAEKGIFSWKTYK